ncbi:MAG: formate dehydrogenase subunit delta [Gammaproteobacteria bacterium]|jgi:formate dehydrogenase subunit delta
MDINKLVRMANQIADNFNTGDQATAAAGVLDHITRFWTLDMKKQIIAHMKDGKTGLNEIAEAAIRELARNEKYAA